MNKEQIISWIFLSIAFASKKEPADIKTISTIADGINHAVPNCDEIQSSISFLLKQNLIEKTGNKYILTLRGENKVEDASKETNIIFKILKNLESQINL